MRRNRQVFIITVLALSVFLSWTVSGCGGENRGGKSVSKKEMYHCPMHPTYISDKPGDCPICGMKLVKMERPVEQTTSQSLMPSPAPEKTPEEVCVEHKCTMQNCTMSVKADIKPGERILCPVCGEVISTANGRVVEITKQPPVMIAQRDQQKKPLYYRNPMNPQATSPVPMKDSMGMDYVPVYEEGQAAPSGPSVMISQEKQQLIGVHTESVKTMNLTKIVRASGKIAYDPDLVVAQEEFVQALNNEDNTKGSPLQDVIDRARSLTDASRSKLRLLGMSDDQVKQLETSRRADTSLYLPSKGEGVWAYLAIYEYEIGLVKSGDSVDIEAVAYPGEIFRGTLISISPVLDPVTRTNQVRVQVPNPESKLKPEMFVNAKIRLGLGEKLAVPETAVLDTGLRKIVYLSEEGDRLEMREVALGQKADGYYEVLSGIKEGDIVVTSGNFLIDSESRLKAAASKGDQDKNGQ